MKPRNTRTAVAKKPHKNDVDYKLTAKLEVRIPRMDLRTALKNKNEQNVRLKPMKRCTVILDQLPATAVSSKPKVDYKNKGNIVKSSEKKIDKENMAEKENIYEFSLSQENQENNNLPSEDYNDLFKKLLEEKKIQIKRYKPKAGALKKPSGLKKTAKSGVKQGSVRGVRKVPLKETKNIVTRGAGAKKVEQAAFKQPSEVVADPHQLKDVSVLLHDLKDQCLAQKPSLKLHKLDNSAVDGRDAGVTFRRKNRADFSPVFSKPPAQSTPLTKKHNPAVTLRKKPAITTTVTSSTPLRSKPDLGLLKPPTIRTSLANESYGGSLYDNPTPSTSSAADSVQAKLGFSIGEESFNAGIQDVNMAPKKMVDVLDVLPAADNLSDSSTSGDEKMVMDLDDTSQVHEVLVHAPPPPNEFELIDANLSVPQRRLTVNKRVSLNNSIFNQLANTIDVMSFGGARDDVTSRNSLAQPIIAEPPLEEWMGDDLSFLDNDMENFEPQTDTISQSANNSVLLPKIPNKHVHFNNGRSPLKEMTGNTIGANRGNKGVVVQSVIVLPPNKYIKSATLFAKPSPKIMANADLITSFDATQNVAIRKPKLIRSPKLGSMNTSKESIPRLDKSSTHRVYGRSPRKTEIIANNSAVQSNNETSVNNLFGFVSDENTDEPSIEQPKAVENKIFKPNKSGLKETREELKKLLHNAKPVPANVRKSPLKQAKRKSPMKQKQNKNVSKKIFEAPVNTQQDIRAAFQTMTATSESNKDQSKEIRDPSPLIFRDLEVEVNTRKSYSGPRQYRKRRVSVTSESEAEEEEEEMSRKKKRNKAKKKKLVDLHEKERENELDKFAAELNAEFAEIDEFEMLKET